MGLTARIRTRDGWAVSHAVVTVTDMTGHAGAARRGGRGGGRAGRDRAGARGRTPSSSRPSGTRPPPSTAIVTASGRAEVGTVTLARQGGTELPPPGPWTVDPAHSSVGAVAQHLGISSVHGRFTDFTGHDRDRPGRRGQVPGGGGHPGRVHRHRQRHAGRPSASADFLDVERYPEITYRSTGLTPAGSDRWTVHGELTLHGVVRPVDLDLAYLGTGADPWGGTRAAFRATTELRREDFAMNYNQVVQAGIAAIGTTLKVELDIQAVQGESLPQA